MSLDANSNSDQRVLLKVHASLDVGTRAKIDMKKIYDDKSLTRIESATPLIVQKWPPSTQMMHEIAKGAQNLMYFDWKVENPKHITITPER